jgi:hypothetical protein
VRWQVNHNFKFPRIFDIDRKFQFFCDIPIILKILYIFLSSCRKRPRDARNIQQLKILLMEFVQIHFVLVCPGLSPLDACCSLRSQLGLYFPSACTNAVISRVWHGEIRHELLSHPSHVNRSQTLNYYIPPATSLQYSSVVHATVTSRAMTKRYSILRGPKRS